MVKGLDFKVIVAVIGMVLWAMPEEVLGEDVEVKNQLSYISRVVGIMESSILKIEGNLRFVRRQVEKTTPKADMTVRRINSLEIKIEKLEKMFGKIQLEVAKVQGSLEGVEKELGGLMNGTCANKFLCRRKK